MADKYLGESIAKLGFGFMRLPRLPSDPAKAGVTTEGPGTSPDPFDMAQVERMVDLYLENGFTYFDTAFIYQGSEEALRDALIKRHPAREKYQIATKLNLMFTNDRAGMEEQFNTTMTRLDTPYIDFYLLHGLGKDSAKKAEEIGAWDYVCELKEQGKIKHLGFSFHGSPEDLDDILTKHPEAEFVQLQLNYLDWESEDVQARRLYEVARAHKTPIAVMEPLKGGKLASESFPPAAAFKAADASASIASWGLRFIAELEGIMVILSGMSTFEQVADNVKTFKSLKPLTEADYKLIAKAAEEIRAFQGIPCTSCNYCSPNCPQNINIPALIDMYNEYLIYQDPKQVGGFAYTFHKAKAKDCIACGVCVSHCPQNIDIPNVLGKLSPLVDK